MLCVSQKSYTLTSFLSCSLLNQKETRSGLLHVEGSRVHISHVELCGPCPLLHHEYLPLLHSQSGSAHCVKGNDGKKGTKMATKPARTKKLFAHFFYNQNEHDHVILSAWCFIRIVSSSLHTNSRNRWEREGKRSTAYIQKRVLSPLYLVLFLPC